MQGLGQEFIKKDPTIILSILSGKMKKFKILTKYIRSIFNVKSSVYQLFFRLFVGEGFRTQNTFLDMPVSVYGINYSWYFRSFETKGRKILNINKLWSLNKYD